MKEVKTVLNVPELTDLCERNANDDEWQEWYGYAIRAEHSALFSDDESLRSNRTLNSNHTNYAKGHHEEETY